MEFIRNTEKKQYGKVKVMFALFRCDSCKKEFEIVKHNGKKQCMCRECGLKNKHKKLSITATKHGGKNTRLYRIWSGIKDRCLNVKSKDFIKYGNRGITICNEWKNDFSTFREWSVNNGYSELLSIDRIDNNGNYEPNNCRWANCKVQSLNKRNTILTLEQIEDIKQSYIDKISYVDVCNKYKNINKKVISNHYYKQGKY